MPTCVETAPAKRRPKLSELPEWFRKAGGNLRVLGELLGGYKPLQIRRWINDAHPDVKAGLERELQAARDEHRQSQRDKRDISKRGPRFRSSLPVMLPLSEVRNLISTYYREPWAVLQGLDLSDFDGMGYEKSTSVRTKPNPTTGETLHQILSWADVKAILETLNEADEHILMAWVGLAAKSPLALRMKAEGYPLETGKAIPARQTEPVLQFVYQALAPKLARQKPSKHSEAQHAR